MRSSPKVLRLKKIRRAILRIDEIHRELSTLPSQPLPTKIFAGHWRYFQVRADVLRSSTGRQVQQIVEQCNHWVLGKKRNPRSYRTSTEVAVNSSETTFYSEQLLRPLSEDQFQAASFPAFFERKWFETVTRYHRVGTKNIPYKKYFPQVPPHMLEFAYKPAYYTETTPPHSELSSELKRLYDFLRETHGWEKINGRHVDEWDMSLGRIRQRDKQQQRELEAFTEELFD
jgi:hypothetical protein